MRTKVAALTGCVLMIGAGLLWADDATASKEVTLTGTMVCGKCELHKTDKCQDVLEVKTGDKEVLYYLDDNKVAKDYHKNVCTKPKENVTVTGVVSEKDGKETIEATKIQ